MRLLAVWLINALALLALPWLLPSIHVASFATALWVAVVLGLINAVIRPVLLLLTLPVTLLTLGLFIFVINGLMFLLAAKMLDGFVVDGAVQLDFMAADAAVAGRIQVVRLAAEKPRNSV